MNQRPHHRSLGSVEPQFLCFSNSHIAAAFSLFLFAFDSAHFHFEYDALCCVFCVLGGPVREFSDGDQTNWESGNGRNVKKTIDKELSITNWLRFQVRVLAAAFFSDRIPLSVWLPLTVLPAFSLQKFLINANIDMKRWFCRTFVSIEKRHSQSGRINSWPRKPEASLWPKSPTKRAAFAGIVDSEQRTCVFEAVARRKWSTNWQLSTQITSIQLNESDSCPWWSWWSCEKFEFFRRFRKSCFCLPETEEMRKSGDVAWGGGMDVSTF
jgi:hypothetical protein